MPIQSIEEAMAYISAHADEAKEKGVYVPKARVNVSANQDNSPKNLLFSISTQQGSGQGALTREGKIIYYVASKRDTGRYTSKPLPVNDVTITKDGKLKIQIEYQTMSDGEKKLISDWLNEKAQPTLAPAKQRANKPIDKSNVSVEQSTPVVQQPVQQAQTASAVHVEQSAPTAQTTTTTTSGSAPELTLVQKRVMARAVELGLYTSPDHAMANFAEWKNSDLKSIG